MSTSIVWLAGITSVFALLAVGCSATPTKADSTSTSRDAPVAQVIEHVTEIHGLRRVDDYYWLRERDNPKTIAYLEAENAYTEAAMQHTEELQDRLFKEIVARIQETDLSVPVRQGEYYYYSRTEEGKDYPIYCRKRGSLEAEEEVLLDQNEIAQGQEYSALQDFEISDDHRLLAYSVDNSGDERHTVYFKNLETGELWPESISNASNVVWANDNRTVFYTTSDETNRPDKVFRHRLGTSVEDDELVFHEPDLAFFLGLNKTRSGRYVIFTLGSISMTELRYLDADDADGEFALLVGREPGVEYGVEHHGDDFLITTNAQGSTNFKLMRAPVADPAPENWEELIGHRSDVLLSYVSAFKDWLIIHEREHGVPQLRVRNISQGIAGGAEHVVEFPEAAYWMRGDQNPEFETNVFRLKYSSMITPESVFDYDLEARELALLKETEVKQYDRSQFESTRIQATAKDGTQVPISIVHRRGLMLDGTNPTLLVGYGSYGASYDPFFSPSRVSLLERGVVFAIAHIRGGGEMGRAWYEAGKFEHKPNTFSDFIACAEHLIAQGYTTPERLAINGGSAGGLLMGAVTNQRPELFRAVVADVPFVDVVTTMLDPTIPLTVIEYNEWGNPEQKEYFDVMIGYSPYDNVTAQDYPRMLITAGLNDPRVQYWEPAKWAAKLRATKTDDNLLLLKTNMGAGHGGASGRYERYREIAFTYAFILDQLEVR